MYKISKTTKPFGEIISIQTGNMCIPCDPANTDYANFKKEVLAGVELLDADGNVMTDAFIATLP
jgi:hypothetical protein